MDGISKKKFSWPLFLSPFVSRLGDELFIFGMNWFIVKATGHASLLGIVQGIGGAILVLGDLLAGPIVDRYNRKNVMLVSDLVSFIACMFAAATFDVKEPVFYQLVLLTVIMDIGLAFNFPAAKAVVPEIIVPSALAKFNSMANSGTMMAQVLAPLLGGFLLTLRWIDFRTFLFVNGISFLLSFILTMMLRYTQIVYMDKRQPVSESLKAGIEYINKVPDLFRLIIFDGFYAAFVAGYGLLLPYEIDHYYGGNERLYSYVLTLYAIGGLAGAIYLTLDKRKPEIHQNYIDAAALALLALVAGIFKNYPVLMGTALAIGFFSAIYGIRMMTIVQQIVAVEFLGRVFAIWFLVFDSLSPLSAFVFGFVADKLNHLTFLILSVLIAAGLIVVWLLGLKERGKK
ncbi:MFS transporter [Pediococcus stilesii]|uniref:MFS transporter n=1 Tax=Pediococcus stilesii TaxID=331679 RepID=A0A5R9BZL5_9LACO|nr:MFS transporter [Pediococcus stilesii]TLQ05770.1 MFS transporter [Pediococcus stilesii]